MNPETFPLNVRLSENLLAESTQRMMIVIIVSGVGFSLGKEMKDTCPHHEIPLMEVNRNPVEIASVAQDVVSSFVA